MDDAILDLPKSGKEKRMDSKKTRIELHCHSVYSERDGVSSVKDLISVSYASGLSGIALTDHNSVAGYGVVRQIKRCSIRQIILGRFRFVAELSVTLKVSVSANCFLELKSPAN